MKKETIISLCLIAIVCFACFAQALAAEDNGVTTNKYNPYTIASVGLSEQLSVSDGSTKVYNIN